MEALGHFIFELFKIAILSVAYAGVLFWVGALFLRLTKRDATFSRRKFFCTYLVLYGILLVFSFTYYGDHGLGDSYHIPLGHGETMSAGDMYAYFEPGGKLEQIDIESYQVKGDYLCIATDSGYLVYNLSTRESINFDTKQEYNTYALKHNLPDADLFLDFFKQYDNYWSGWRFWTMP